MNKILEELNEIKNKVIQGMFSYLEQIDDDNFDPGYTKDDVNKCSEILTMYLSSVLASEIHGNAFKILDLVKSTVVSLNELNDDCDYNLIETDQREAICELISSAAEKAGLESEENDITEEWREW